MSGKRSKQIKNKLVDYLLDHQIPLSAKTKNRKRNLKKLVIKGMDVDQAILIVSRYE